MVALFNLKTKTSGQMHRAQGRKQRRCQISDLIQHKGPIGVDEKKRRGEQQQNLTWSESWSLCFLFVAANNIVYFVADTFTDHEATAGGQV